MIMKQFSITVREAQEKDLSAIRDIFYTVYSSHYPYPQFYDVDWLKRSVFSDNIILLVAVDNKSGTVLGSSSVVLDIGAHSDLVGEFGRLVVHPEPRERGIGNALMAKRIELVRNRLHLGLVENRTSHVVSQKISLKHRFVPVGFLPLKIPFNEQRESMALSVQYFGDALRMRNNHPRIIPEAHGLARSAFTNCSVECDAVVDDQTPPYPHCAEFDVKELTTGELPTLLQIQRGRVSRRELFGPLRLHYGFFRLQMAHAQYLVAHEPAVGGKPGRLVGAVGYIRNDHEKLLKIYELITTHDLPVRFLVEQLLKQSQAWEMEYIEADISAHAPRMQRTFLELGFLPVAYIPAMVFCDVERIDVVRMAMIRGTLDTDLVNLIPEVQPLAESVLRAFTKQSVEPAISEAAGKISLFQGLSPEQTQLLAGLCRLAHFQGGDRMFVQGAEAGEMFLVMEGRVSINVDATFRRIGYVEPGESVGERALLTGKAHTAAATAKTNVLAAVLTRNDLTSLIRQRPDIGLVLYRNLAIGLGQKLLRTDT